MVAIGEKAAKIAAGAREQGCAAVHWFAEKEEALGLLSALAGPDTAVLVKASHAMQFQTIVAELTEKND